jgi:hypothetical protein
MNRPCSKRAVDDGYRDAVGAGQAGRGGKLRKVRPFGTSGVGRAASNVARGALSSASLQGVAVATGLQDKFS